MGKNRDLKRSSPSSSVVNKIVPNPIHLLYVLYYIFFYTSQESLNYEKNAKCKVISYNASIVNELPQDWGIKLANTLQEQL